MTFSEVENFLRHHQKNSIAAMEKVVEDLKVAQSEVLLAQKEKEEKAT